MLLVEIFDFQLKSRNNLSLSNYKKNKYSQIHLVSQINKYFIISESYTLVKSNIIMYKINQILLKLQKFYLSLKFSLFKNPIQTLHETPKYKTLQPFPTTQKNQPNS